MQETDVAVKDGKVVAIGDMSYFGEAREVIEAKGKIVIPGGIDTHVHFEDPPFMGLLSRSTFAMGTKAAAVGGTTTVIDFCYQEKRELPIDAYLRRRRLADDQVAVDYALHMIIVDVFPELLETMGELVQEGMPSFKVYMIYRSDGLMVDDAVILELMRAAKKHNAFVGAHAENPYLAEYYVEQAVREGKTAPIYHALTKPTVVESEAIHRALFLAKHAGVPYYNFHTSCGSAVEMARDERAQGRPVYLETCPHYLVLTKSMLEREDGSKWICSPPLRDLEDVEMLWEGIRDGHVSTTGSDDVSFNYSDKLPFKSFEQVPNGLPGGLDHRLSVLFSEGVLKNRISLNRFVQVTSTNAAKIMGLYPRKGVIMPGSDADIVVLDPNKEAVISAAESLRGFDWDAFEGIRVKGLPIMTMLRGRTIARDGAFTGHEGYGQFLRRSIPDCGMIAPLA